MIQSILRLIVVAIILVAIYFAVALIVTGIWLKLTLALLIVCFIAACVKLFALDTLV